MSDSALPLTLFEPAARGALELESEADLASLVALSGLPNLTPKRLWSLLSLGPPAEAWERVRAGAAPRTGRATDAADGWSQWAAAVEPKRLLDQHRSRGIGIHPFGAAGYPKALLDDPEPPALIFTLGSAAPGTRTGVGIVGTRRCTPYGRDVAHELGAALAARGAHVVSGLARGIDAAAHVGARKADETAAVAVVAGGVDVVFPRSNAALWRAVAVHGVILTEWPLGARPIRWRFPARNRLIAALSEAVVVVESAAKGGSMYTVDEALARDRSVFAVPGSIRSPVSAGTNRLIAEGANPLHSFDELFDDLALVAPAGAAVRGGVPAGDSWLFELIGWEPAAIDDVVARSGRPAAEVTLEVERTIARGGLRRLGSTIERAR